MMKNMTFTFTAQQIEVIGNALMQMPYGIAAPVINEINKQIQAASITQKIDKQDLEKTS